MSKVPDPLWGVDDSSESKRLVTKAYKEIPFWQRVRADLLFLLAAAVIGAITMLLMRWGRIPLWTGGAIAGFACTAGLAGWRQRRIQATLSSVLRAEGRCTHCGYKLEAPDVSKCPECGTASGNGRPAELR